MIRDEIMYGIAIVALLLFAFVLMPRYEHLTSGSGAGASMNEVNRLVKEVEAALSENTNNIAINNTTHTLPASDVMYLNQQLDVLLQLQYGKKPISDSDATALKERLSGMKKILGPPPSGPAPFGPAPPGFNPNAGGGGSGPFTPSPSPAPSPHPSPAPSPHPSPAPKPHPSPAHKHHPQPTNPDVVNRLDAMKDINKLLDMYAKIDSLNKEYKLISSSDLAMLTTSLHMLQSRVELNEPVYKNEISSEANKVHSYLDLLEQHDRRKKPGSSSVLPYPNRTIPGPRDEIDGPMGWETSDKFVLKSSLVPSCTSCGTGGSSPWTSSVPGDSTDMTQITPNQYNFMNPKSSFQNEEEPQPFLTSFASFMK